MKRGPESARIGARKAAGPDVATAEADLTTEPVKEAAVATALSSTNPPSSSTLSPSRARRYVNGQPADDLTRRCLAVDALSRLYHAGKGV